MSKYPRSFHLPWSPGATNDDKKMETVKDLLNTPLIITEKMDGSNVCLERENCYARSHNKPPKHSSFDGFKALHAAVKHHIPEDMQIFGEWLYAKHSINYYNLPSYLMLFGIRDKISGEWADWNHVYEMAIDLGVSTVPVLERDLIITSTSQLKEITNQLGEQKSEYGCREGIVVRRQYRFNGENFPRYLGKWVRQDHNQIDEYWMRKEIEPNKLKK